MHSRVKKTCLLERVTLQLRYERGKSQRERVEGQRKAKGRESEDQIGKVGRMGETEM